mgnify:CR=1 FL=1
MGTVAALAEPAGRVAGGDNPLSVLFSPPGLAGSAGQRWGSSHLFSHLHFVQCSFRGSCFGEGIHCCRQPPFKGGPAAAHFLRRQQIVCSVSLGCLLPYSLQSACFYPGTNFIPLAGHAFCCKLCGYFLPCRQIAGSVRACDKPAAGGQFLLWYRLL